MNITPQSKEKQFIESVRRQDLTLLFLKETDVKHKEVNNLKLKGWKKIYHTNCTHKKDVLSLLTCINIR